jgi:hypothetical protein
MRNSTLRDALLGTAATVALSISLMAGALAVVGTPPTPYGGPALQDSQWLLGLSQGNNYAFQSGISAAGTTQATATALPSGVFLIEVDTAAASSGINLPFCIPGLQLQIYNNGAQTLTIYPAVANNPLTSAQDTINNTTTLSLSSHTATSPACAKAGNWFAS